jgi:hypothetical protein
MTLYRLNISFPAFQLTHDAQVFVRGQWDHWTRSIPLVLSKDKTSFSASVFFRSETPSVSFKFIVNDQWTTSTEYPTVYDDIGNLNNCSDAQESADQGTQISVPFLHICDCRLETKLSPEVLNRQSEQITPSTDQVNPLHLQVNPFDELCAFKSPPVYPVANVPSVEHNQGSEPCNESISRSVSETPSVSLKFIMSNQWTTFKGYPTGYDDIGDAKESADQGTQISFLSLHICDCRLEIEHSPEVLYHQSEQIQSTDQVTTLLPQVNPFDELCAFKSPPVYPDPVANVPSAVHNQGSEPCNESISQSVDDSQESVSTILNTNQSKKICGKRSVMLNGVTLALTKRVGHLVDKAKDPSALQGLFAV